MNVSVEGRVDRAVLKHIDPALADRPERRLRRDDVVFNNTNSPELVGKTALFDEDDEPAFSNHMTRLRVEGSRLDPGFLALQLHQAWREGWFAQHCNNHVSQASIGRDVLQGFELVLPPLDIQRAITRLGRVVNDRRASAGSHIANARRAVERFRQAVLVAACTGRLTDAWREKHGVAPWGSARADDVCAKVQSGTTPKLWHTGDNGIPFLKVYNIVDQRLDFDYRPQFIAPELHHGAMARATALPGDVLMNIVGPPLGKVAIVTDQYPEWSINQALTLFRPSEQVTTDWLYIYLCSGISVEDVLNQTRGTVGQVNISLSQCRDFQIPVPSLEEQAEILRRVGELLVLSDGLIERIGIASRSLGRTSQSVLAKALRGDSLEVELTSG